MVKVILVMIVNNSDNSPSLPFILKSAYRKFELSTFHRSKVTVIWKQETAHCNNADKCRELKMNAEKFREMQRNSEKCREMQICRDILMTFMTHGNLISLNPLHLEHIAHILIDKCFPKNGPMGKILNRGNFKISYSTCPNMKQVFQI